MAADGPRVLHVLNYGWPYIDGYTVRSQGLITAQRRHLGWPVEVAVSPFRPFTRAADPEFVLPEWGPARQHSTGLPATGYGVTALERPSLGLAPATSARFRAGLERLVSGVRPGIIHAHHPHYVGATARRTARARRLPFVYEIRCFNGDYDRERRNPYVRERGRYQNLLELRMCRLADAVVTISDGLAERIVVGGTPADRVFVVRNSVDNELFRSAQNRRPPGDTLTIGYATTFEVMEGLDTLLGAVPAARAALAARGRTLRVRLAGIGRDWERIRALVTKLGLADTVDLPGFVPFSRMPEFYGGLDLFVVPRRATPVASATTPLKPLEALASELPLLVSDLPALRELLDGRPGVRFVAPVSAALAAALVSFADAPWRTSADAIADRTWRQEARRYEAVYAAAVRNAAITRRAGV